MADKVDSVRRVKDGKPILPHPELDFLSRNGVLMFAVVVSTAITLAFAAWFVPKAIGPIAGVLVFVVGVLFVSLFLQQAKNRELEYRLIVLERALGLVVDADE